MSQWIRNYKPSEIDADEWGNILVLRENGQKAVYHWEDYNEHYATEETAWMTLPESDFPKSVSVTIEVGDRSYTVENNGFTIEIHDSRDPMGQPTTFGTNGDTITGILEAVDAILQEELHGNCECEDELDETALTVEDIENILAAEAEVEQLQDAMKAHLNELRGNTVAVPASRKPWQKKN